MLESFLWKLTASKKLAGKTRLVYKIAQRNFWDRIHKKVVLINGGGCFLLQKRSPFKRTPFSSQLRDGFALKEIELWSVFDFRRGWRHSLYTVV